MVIHDTYVAKDINGTDMVIQASSNRATATTTLHVREAERAVSFEGCKTGCHFPGPMQTEGALDGFGNTLDGLSFHEIVEYEMHYQNSAGR